MGADILQGNKLYTCQRNVLQHNSDIWSPSYKEGIKSVFPNEIAKEL